MKMPAASPRCIECLHGHLKHPCAGNVRQPTTTATLFSPGSWRAKRAWKPLDNRRRCLATSAAKFLVNWQWLKETLKLKRYFLYTIQRYAYDYGVGALWLQAILNNDEWRAEYQHELPEISHVSDFSLLMVKLDKMHLLNLGIVLVTAGSSIALLVARRRWG